MCTPALDLIPDSLLRFAAYSWGKTREKPTIFAPYRPGTKREPQKIESLIFIGTLPPVVFAIYDFRLLGMYRQLAFSKTLPNFCFQLYGLFQASAMDDYIIRIPFKPNVWLRPLYPQVKSVMQIEVRQQGADNPPLRSTTIARMERPFRILNR